MKQLTLFLFTLSISVLAAINKPPIQVLVKESIPVVITKPITPVSEIDTTVSKKETTVSKKETQGLCLKDARVLPPLQNPVITCSSEPKCEKLAEAIIFEARGEPDIGKVAVAYVILNRVKDPRWGGSIREVVHQPKQFSYLKDKHKQKPPTQNDWSRARKIAHDVILGATSNPIGNATHYHATHVKPKWANRLQLTGKIGGHVFYE